jgi:hypothetical protein
LRARGERDLRRKNKTLTTEGTGDHRGKALTTKDTKVHEGKLLKYVDRAFAGALFLISIVECWLVPRDYVGRIWIFGTGLALLFAAMLNLLRIRNGYSVHGLRLFCVGANVVMTVFVAALMASIGHARTFANPQVVVVFGLLVVETGFSFGKSA